MLRVLSRGLTPPWTACRRRFSAKAADQAAKQLEFERMVRGLAVFQVREGHLAVPYKFVVPKEEEEEEESVAWPEETRGMALGRKFHFVSMQLVRGLQDPHKRQLLASVGVPVDDWSEYKWKTVTLPALQTYKRLHGDLMVPITPAFVVPSDDAEWPRATWGQSLGKAVDILRKTRTELSVDRVKALDEMGFVWDVSAFKWQHQVFPALAEYKKRFGDVNVPQDFVVPRDDESWPEELRGIKLGKTLNIIRSERVFMSVPGAEDQLNEIGFDWDPRQTRFDDQILPSLETFKQLHGHCNVPCEFVVPSEAPWPDRAWGLKLGEAVVRIRSYGSFKEQIAKSKERWDALGFDWNLLATRFEQQILPSLETFKSLHGHCWVPYSFVVPSESPWPTEAWGLKLGITVSTIRSERSFKEQIAKSKERWDALGFAWDALTTRFEQQVLPSLEIFKSLHGHCRVPHSFVVPSEAPWPDRAWGLKLGEAVVRIRSYGSFKEQIAKSKERWDALGFDWDPLTSRFEELLSSLETYKSLYGHCRVPYSFVVPSESPWPTEAWGLTLGQRVRSLRLERSFKEHIAKNKERWDALKFDWDPLTTRFEQQILPSLQTFKSLHGHCRVPHSFVVPSESPWPTEAWGLRLGRTVNTLRSQRCFKEQIAKNKERWDALKFDWDPLTTRFEQQILPALRVFKRLHYHCRVPHSFVVPSESPWPTKAWGVELGLVWSRIRHHCAFQKQIAKHQKRWNALTVEFDEKDFWRW